MTRRLAAVVQYQSKAVHCFRTDQQPEATLTDRPSISLLTFSGVVLQCLGSALHEFGLLLFLSFLHFPSRIRSFHHKRLQQKIMMGRLDSGLRRGARHSSIFLLFSFLRSCSRDRKTDGEKRGVMTKILAYEKEKATHPFICLKKRSIIYSGTFDESKGCIVDG
ncbi:hypothetical protein LZ32DRAFT_263298 [Colletotrichum eremochloae]|nr:hypothetical protein LZ32DRAFT_263298 [Colletotrichum eremochloae]